MNAGTWIVPKTVILVYYAAVRRTYFINTLIPYSNMHNLLTVCVICHIILFHYLWVIPPEMFHHWYSQTLLIRTLVGHRKCPY